MWRSSAKSTRLALIQALQTFSPTLDALMKFFSFLLIGNWKKYKPIRSKKVAEALLSIAQNKEKGFRIYESDAIERQ